MNAPVTLHPSPFTAHGVTLMDLVVASTVSLVVVLAVGQLDVTRIFLAEQVRQSAGMGSEARLAMAQFVRDAQQADRVNVNPAGDLVQLRIPQLNCTVCACPPPPADVPEPSCLDQANAYRWVQYRQTTGTDILFYDDTQNGCRVDRTFHDIKQPGGFVVRYRDVAQAPPGGHEPFAGEDNNVLDTQIITASSSTQGMTEEMVYVNTMTLRPGAYTNVGAGGGDSGLGLDVTNQSPPPPPC